MDAVGEDGGTSRGGDDLAGLRYELRRDARTRLVIDSSAVDGSAVVHDGHGELHELSAGVCRACELLHRIAAVGEGAARIIGFGGDVGPAAEPDACAWIEKRLVDRSRFGVVGGVARIGRRRMDGELGIEDSVGVGHDDVLLEHAVAIRVVECGYEERDARHPRHGCLIRLVEGQSTALHLVGSCISGLRDVYHDSVLADGYALRPAFVHQVAFGRLDLADLVCAIGKGACCQLSRAAGIGDERADERARVVERAVHEDGGFGARPHAEARPAQRCSPLGHPVSGLGIDLADAEATADDGVGEGRCDPDDRS